MDKKKVLSSTADFSQTILTVQTPQVEQEAAFTQATSTKSLKKTNRKKRPPENGERKRKK